MCVPACECLCVCECVFVCACVHEYVSKHAIFEVNAAKQSIYHCLFLRHLFICIQVHRTGLNLFFWRTGRPTIIHVPNKSKSHCRASKYVHALNEIP